MKKIILLLLIVVLGYAVLNVSGEKQKESAQKSGDNAAATTVEGAEKAEEKVDGGEKEKVSSSGEGGEGSAADNATGEQGKSAAVETYGFSPIEQDKTLNEAKVALGEQLFHDTMLSADNTVSCATCHSLSKGGTDQLPVSIGIKGQKGPINSPTVFNSSNNFVQFWDGRAKDLEEQALGPVENPLEMGENWDNVVEKIKKSGKYDEAFSAIYEGAITKEHIADAIAEFERSLITPDSPFDDYLRGNKDALTEEQIRGFALFNDKGCASCHSGNFFGGESYQAMSAQYFADRGNLTEADNGRYNVTKDEADKHVFKVPMLRNVAVTAPYFHDGQVKTLEEAVAKMAKYQLGEELKEEEVKAIAAFLRSLTGKYKGVPLDKIKEE